MNFLFHPLFNLVELLFVAVGVSLLMSNHIGLISCVALAVAGGIISGIGQHFLDRRGAA